MTLLSDHMTLADVKNRLSEVVDQVEREHARVVITKRGRPAAVVISIDDLESLEETLEVLNDHELMADIREGLVQRRNGELETLSREDALKLIRHR